MRIGTLVIFLFLFGVFYPQITPGSCSDGTPYGKCSNVTAGKFCTGLITNPTLQDNAIRCKCSSVPGYTTDPSNPDRCIALQAGCANNNPPCKEYEECINNKCEKKKGCQYGNPPCPPTQECVDNQCVIKSGCLFNNPPCPLGQVCNAVTNTCISALEIETAQPSQSPSASPPTKTEAPETEEEGPPELITYEPRKVGLCCASALAILAVGFMVIVKKS
ncbi:MAG: hypothetical protein QXW70_01690 [Candidatus Anstonellales archaeon]